MNDFIKTLLADLKDRRFLPYVALVGVALIAAVGYAALGGGSSATPTASPPLSGPPACRPTPLDPGVTPSQPLPRLTPLRSAARPLLVFRGVTAGGKSATFTPVGEAILPGVAACLPNATQCHAIDLHKERYEQPE